MHHGGVRRNVNLCHINQQLMVSALLVIGAFEVFMASAGERLFERRRTKGALGQIWKRLNCRSFAATESVDSKDQVAENLKKMVQSQYGYDRNE